MIKEIWTKRWLKMFLNICIWKKKKEKLELKSDKNTFSANDSQAFSKTKKIFKRPKADYCHVRYVGGSHYTHTGAAVEPLCLSRNPEWGNYRDGTDGAKAYGAEYETDDLSGKWLKLHDHDVPCTMYSMLGS